MRRKKLPETSIAYACLLAAYPVGIVFFDWLTHDRPNLPWQLGGYAALLLIAIASLAGISGERVHQMIQAAKRNRED